MSKLLTLHMGIHIVSKLYLMDAMIWVLEMDTLVATMAENPVVNCSVTHLDNIMKLHWSLMFVIFMEPTKN